MIFIHFLFSYLSTVAFGVLTNVPRRTLLASGLTGSVGWIVFHLMREAGYSLGFANFIAAFLIGCGSIFFSRLKKIPMLVFIVPSLVPLVPGGPAYLAVREIVIGDGDKGLYYILIVAVTAGAIAGGFVMTTLVEKIVARYQNTHSMKS